MSLNDAGVLLSTLLRDLWLDSGWEVGKLKTHTDYFPCLRNVKWSVWACSGIASDVWCVVFHMQSENLKGRVSGVDETSQASLYRLINFAKHLLDEPVTERDFQTGRLKTVQNAGTNREALYRYAALQTIEGSVNYWPCHLWHALLLRPLFFRLVSKSSTVGHYVKDGTCQFHSIKQHLFTISMTWRELIHCWVTGVSVLLRRFQKMATMSALTCIIWQVCRVALRGTQREVSSCSCCTTCWGTCPWRSPNWSNSISICCLSSCFTDILLQSQFLYHFYIWDKLQRLFFTWISIWVWLILKTCGRILYLWFLLFFFLY